MKTRTIKEVSNGLEAIETHLIIKKWEKTGLMQGFGDELKHRMAVALEFLSTYIINERDKENDEFLSSSINTLFPVLHLLYKANECVEPKFLYDEYKTFARKNNVDQIDFDSNEEVLDFMHKFMSELKGNENFYTHTYIHVEA